MSDKVLLTAHAPSVRCHTETICTTANRLACLIGVRYPSMGASESTKNLLRPTITSHDMHVLFTREFARVKRSKCKRCRAPLPFWGPGAPDKPQGYWYLPTPRMCAHGCRQLLAGLWVALTAEYEIAPPHTKYVRQPGMRSYASRALPLPPIARISGESADRD